MGHSQICLQTNFASSVISALSTLETGLLRRRLGRGVREIRRSV
jgi:hypothetical protein